MSALFLGPVSFSFAWNPGPRGLFRGTLTVWAGPRIEIPVAVYSDGGVWLGAPHLEYSTDYGYGHYNRTLQDDAYRGEFNRVVLRELRKTALWTQLVAPGVRAEDYPRAQGDDRIPESVEAVP
jgi:hypothetical protein